MIGGFLGCGTSEIMMDAIVEKGVKDLTIIGNDTGFETIGAGKLVTAKQVSHIIATHVGTNKQTGIQMSSGETKVTLVPQGTLVEQIRAAGMGLGAVLTPTGLGIMVAEGKDVITVDGKEYLLEKPVKADVAILKGTIVDKAGNVYYEGTTKNFQQVMALAADTVIVEAEKLVEVGELDPNMVMTPAILVDYIVVGGDK
jgi:acetate CoA/acetoacetate CoA-transferase alpha subunit